MKIFKRGIEIWDARNTENGGHSRWLARIFSYRVNYFYVGVCTFKIGYTNEFYDGNHHAIWLGFIVISFGT